MKLKRVSVWTFTLASGLWLTTYSIASTFNAQSTKEESAYQRPEDLLDKVPFLSKIPRSFLFGDGYKVKLGTSDLRIDHMGTNSRNPVSRRTCLFGLSYTTPVAGFFTSRLDIPLLHSSDLRMSDWERTSFGDYVAYFSKGAATTPSLQFVLTARFK